MRNKWIIVKSTPVLANYIWEVQYDMIEVGAISAPITITLPPAINLGDTYIVKDGYGSASAHNITVQGSTGLSGGDLIDGASTLVISGNYLQISFCYGIHGWSSTNVNASDISVVLGGDVTGAAGSNTVASIQGVVISGTPSAGETLIATSPTAAAWSNTGGTVTLSGDVTGAADANTVAKIQGVAFTAGAPTKGQFVVATSTTGLGYVTISGDVSESSATAGLLTVAKANGASVPAAGALTVGNVLQVAGISTLSYGAVNLAGGSNYVTGNLPITNLAPAGTDGYFLQTNGSGVNTWTNMTGDVSISSSGVTTVLDIHGASVPAAGSLTTGNVLQVSGSSALTYGALNLAGGAAYVTGNLPIANVAPGTSAQVLMSNGTPASTWTTFSGGATVSPTGVVSLVASTITLGGDTTGTAAANTNVAIQGNTVTSGALVEGDLFIATSTSNWAATAVTGDVAFSTSTPGATKVVSLTGASGSIPIASTGNKLTWAAATTTPGLAQTAPTTDVATNNLVLTSQAPYASAVTNLTPGNIQLSCPSPVSGTAYGYVEVITNGSANIIMGGYPGSATIGCLWAGPTTTPSTSNMGLILQTTATTVNAPSSGTVNLDIAATSVMSVTSSAITAKQAFLLSNGSGTGSNLFSGTGAPASGLGSNGDYYFRNDGSTTTHIYFKASGSWSGII
jgi:hypothetical protein